MAGFEVTMNGRFWVIAEEYVTKPGLDVRPHSLLIAQIGSQSHVRLYRMLKPSVQKLAYSFATGRDHFAPDLLTKNRPTQQGERLPPWLE